MKNRKSSAETSWYIVTGRFLCKKVEVYTSQEDFWEQVAVLDDYGIPYKIRVPGQGGKNCG